MNQNVKDQVCRAIATVLKRSVGKDIILTTERVADAVELILDMQEPSGIASLSPDLEDTAWDLQKAEPVHESPTLDIPPARQAVLPVRPAAGPGKRIIMPDDPEFNAAKPADLPERKRLVVSALEVMRRPPRRPGSNVPEKQYWDEAALMKVVDENTPNEVEFETTGPDGYAIKLKAIKNVLNQQGMGSVILTYRHPAVSEQTTGAVTVDLIAKVPFSLYDENADIDKAMNEPKKGIMAQLEGMYAARPETMAPQAGPEPAPLGRASLRTSPMQDRVDIGAEYDGNDQLVNPGEHVFRDVRESQRTSNDNLAPVGHRFQRK